MPDGIDPRWPPTPPSYPHEPGVARPDSDWRPGAPPSGAWSGGSPPPDVAAQIAAHQGPVLPPPRLSSWSTHSRWWLAVAAVVVVGAAVIAAIVFVPSLYRGIAKHASNPSQAGSSPVHSSTRAGAPATSSASPGANTLQPGADGLVHVVTKSGKTQCAVSTQSVTCYADFTNSPVVDGQHASEVEVTTSGHLQWDTGKAGTAQDKVQLNYQTYEAQGWTISATTDGTRFTNDSTHHGLFTSIDKVESF